MSYKELYEAIKNCMYDRPCSFCSQFKKIFNLYTGTCIEDILKRLADILGVIDDEEQG